MEETIKIIDGFDNILEVLQEFSQCFYILQIGTANTLEIAKKLATKGTVLGLYDNNKILGFAAFYANDFVNKTAFLSLFAVSPEYRKMGYGKKLINEVISKSKIAGMNKLVLQVRKKNLRAISFYSNFGFNMTYDVKDTYFMEKTI